MHLWKSCTNSLATRVNLNRMVILEPASCPFCLVAPETEDHLFRQCEFVMNVFCAAGINLDVICWSWVLVGLYGYID